MSTRALRAHFNLMCALKDSVRTHRRDEPIERRGSNMTQLQAVWMARNGRKSGPKARDRKPKRKDVRAHHGG